MTTYQFLRLIMVTAALIWFCWFSLTEDPSGIRRFNLPTFWRDAAGYLGLAAGIVAFFIVVIFFFSGGGHGGRSSADDTDTGCAQTRLAC